MKYQKADYYFSRWVRQRDADWKGECACPLCNLRSRWQDFTCGHLIKRAILNTRWYPDNGFAVCGKCNCEMEGNEALKEKYRHYVLNRIGPDRWAGLMTQRMSRNKYIQAEIDEICEMYKRKIAEL